MGGAWGVGVGASRPAGEGVEAGAGDAARGVGLGGATGAGADGPERASCWPQARATASRPAVVVARSLR